MSKRSRDREKEIRQLLAEQERSGESVKAFAERRGVSPWTLYDWRRKLGRRARRSKPRHQDQAAEFVSVRIAGADSRWSAFEVILDGVTTLRVAAGFDEAELTRLIRALRASC